MYRFLSFIFFVMLAPRCEAARPLVTDDARLTTARSCQLESWTRLYADHREVWALPACNLTGNLEITAGFGHQFGAEGAASSDVVLQAKTLLHPMTQGGWGVGLAAGLIHHPSVNPGPNGLGSLYAYVPVSVALAGDMVTLHGNLGWVKARDDDHALSWGLGSETRLSRRMTFVAEGFGDPRHSPYWQGGLRYFLVMDRVQIDATVGQQLGKGEGTRWFSVGLRLTPGRMF